MAIALLLPCGLDTWAVPLESVREVISRPVATPVPTAPRAVCGLVNVRGEIVPLLDTGLLASAAPVGTATFAAVVESAEGPAALAATGLPEVAELGEPVAVPEGAGTVSTHAVGDRLATLLDLALLMTPARIAAA